MEAEDDCFEVDLHQKESCLENHKLAGALRQVQFESWRKQQKILPPDSLEDLYNCTTITVDPDSTEQLNKSWKKFQILISTNLSMDLPYVWDRYQRLEEDSLFRNVYNNWKNDSLTPDDLLLFKKINISFDEYEKLINFSSKLEDSWKKYQETHPNLPKNLSDAWNKNQKLRSDSRFRKLFDDWKNKLEKSKKDEDELNENNPWKDAKSLFPNLVKNLEESWTKYQKAHPTYLPVNLSEAWDRNQKLDRLFKTQYDDWKSKLSDQNSMKKKVENKKHVIWTEFVKNRKKLVNELEDSWKDYRKTHPNLPVNLSDAWDRNQELELEVLFKTQYEDWKKVQSIISPAILKKMEDISWDEYEQLFSSVSIEKLENSWKDFVENLENISKHIKNLGSSNGSDNNSSQQSNSTIQTPVLPTNLKEAWNRYQKLEEGSQFKPLYDNWKKGEALISDELSTRINISWEQYKELILNNLVEMRKSWEWYQEIYPTYLPVNLSEAWNRNQKLESDPQFKIQYEKWKKNLSDVSMKDEVRNNKYVTWTKFVENRKILVDELKKSWNKYQEGRFAEPKDLWSDSESIPSISPANSQDLWNTLMENQLIEAVDSITNMMDSKLILGTLFNNLKNSPSENKKLVEDALFSKLYAFWRKKHPKNSEITEMTKAWTKTAEIEDISFYNTINKEWMDYQEDWLKSLPKQVFDSWLLINEERFSSSLKELDDFCKELNHQGEDVVRIMDLKTAFDNYQKPNPTIPYTELKQKWKDVGNIDLSNTDPNLQSFQNTFTFFKEILEDLKMYEECVKDYEVKDLKTIWKYNKDESLPIADKKVYTSWTKIQKILDKKDFEKFQSDWKGNQNSSIASIKKLQNSWEEHWENIKLVFCFNFKSIWNLNQKLVLGNSVNIEEPSKLKKYRKENQELYKRLYNEWVNTLSEPEKNEISKTDVPYDQLNSVSMEMKISWTTYQKKRTALLPVKLNDAWNLNKEFLSDLPIYIPIEEDKLEELTPIFEKLFEDWKLEEPNQTNFETNKTLPYDSVQANIIENLGKSWMKYKENCLAVLHKELWISWGQNQKLESDPQFKIQYEDWKSTLSDISIKEEVEKNKHVTWTKFVENRINSVNQLEDSWKDYRKTHPNLPVNLSEAWDQSLKIDSAPQFKTLYDDWKNRNQNGKLDELCQSWIEFQKKVSAHLPKDNPKKGTFHVFLGHWKRNFSNCFQAIKGKDENVLKEIYGEEYENKKNEDFVSTVDKLYQEIDGLYLDNDLDVTSKEVENLKQFKKTKHKYLKDLHTKKESEKIFKPDDCRRPLEEHKDRLEFMQRYLYQVVKQNAIPRNYICTIQRKESESKKTSDFLNFYKIKNCFGEEDGVLVCCFNQYGTKKFFTMTTFYLIQNPSFTTLEKYNKTFVFHRNDPKRGLLLTIKENWNSFFQYFRMENKEVPDSSKILEILDNTPLYKIIENEPLHKAQDQLLKLIENCLKSGNDVKSENDGTLELSYSVNNNSTLKLNLKFKKYNNSEKDHFYLETANLEKKQ